MTFSLDEPIIYAIFGSVRHRLGTRQVRSLVGGVATARASGSAVREREWVCGQQSGPDTGSARDRGRYFCHTLGGGGWVSETRNPFQPGAST